MKKITLLLAGAIAAGAALTSCDSVSEDDRFVPAEIIPRRAVLLEEFTGQGCKNCPDGHAAIRDITAMLGDSVVAVGVHASSLALNPPLGLKTQTGEEYYKAAGSPAEPTAVLNMQGGSMQVAAWGSAINRAILTPTPYTVRAEAHTSADEKTYDIDVAFSSGEDFNGKLMVWICENDIVRRQLDGTVWIEDYVHNHVFRAAATEDIWGDPVELKANEPQTKHYSYTINPTDYWDLSNIYVVAFLYNNDAGVVQVTQTSH